MRVSRLETALWLLYPRIVPTSVSVVAPLVRTTTTSRSRGVEQGHEVAACELSDDFSLGTVHWGDVFEFDKADFDFGSRVVERPLEVLFGGRPAVGEVVVDSVGSHRVKDVAESAGLVSGLNGAFNELGGLPFT